MKRNSTYELLRDKTGAALLTVLTVFLVLVVLIVSATMVAQANFLRAKTSSDHASAYYIAESGINEYYALFEDYFEKNSKDNTFDSSFVDAFLAEIDADDNGVKAFDYDSLMNQSAKAEVSLEYKGQVADDYNMEITSTGYLGNEIRSVTFSLNINNERTSVGYQPNSILAMEFPPYENGGLSNLTLPNAKNLTGPLVTNKPLVANNTIFYGAFVTNNIIKFDGWSNKWENAVIVTSSSISFPVPYRTEKVKSIVLKPGAYLDFVSNTTLSVDYLFLPLSARGNVSSYFRLNGVNNQALANSYLASLKVLYYDPVDFNPFDINEYVHHDFNKTKNFKPVDVFGVEPNFDKGIKGTDYKEYFRSDFVLDITDIEEAKKFIPQVVLPKRPVYRDKHIDGSEYQVEKFGNSNYTLVDANNNLVTTSDSFYGGGQKIVKLGANPSEYSGAKKSERHYNSIDLFGSPEASNPLILDIGDRDVTIVVQSLKWTGNVRIVGTGSLKIFVIGKNGVITPSDIQFNFTSLTMRESANGPNIHDSTRFQVIVYETTSPVKITTQSGSNFEFNGIIFSENINIDSRLNYYGSFISAKGKDVQFNDAGNGIKADLIFAPESTIKLGGKVFEGVAVGKNFEYSGGILVSFESNFDKALSDVLDNVISIGGEGGGGSSSGTLSRKPVREVSP